jgi:hypothetical protein
LNLTFSFAAFAIKYGAVDQSTPTSGLSTLCSSSPAGSHGEPGRWQAAAFTAYALHLESPFYCQSFHFSVSVLLSCCSVCSRRLRNIEIGPQPRRRPQQQQ